MAIKKTKGKKKAVKKVAKKAAAKKASVKKSKKETVKKKLVKKKVSGKKKSKTPARKKPAGGPAKKHTKPKLGFDPLSHEDIAALTSPAGTVEPLQDEGLRTGLDALIRDTSHEEAPLIYLDEPEAVPSAPAPEPEPAEPEEAMEPDLATTESASEPAPAPEAEVPEIPKPQEPEYKGPPVEETRPQEPSVAAGPATQPSVEIGAPEAGDKKAAPSPVGPKVRDEDEQAGFSKFFSFMLGGENFAIVIDRVSEVLEYQSPTKVPKTPEHMIGVINLRGGVVPVVDLRLRFGMPEAQRTVDSAIIIIEVQTGEERATIGALVDGVREVMDIRDSDVTPPPRLGTGLNTDYISGMGKYGEEFVMILDTDRAFSVESIM